MSPITTHVLDQGTGRPAVGVKVALERLEGASWRELGQGMTDADGRLKTLLPAGSLALGTYRLSFMVGPYFTAQSKPAFYDVIPIQFQVHEAVPHYHVPLLLSPFGYATYRGS